MIAVTGASGLLGANLVRELLAQGCRIRAVIHRDHRAVSGLDLEIVSADLTDPSSLESAFAGVDVVCHLASLNGSQLERHYFRGCGEKKIVYKIIVYNE